MRNGKKKRTQKRRTSRKRNGKPINRRWFFGDLSFHGIFGTFFTWFSRFMFITY